jgi:phosphoglycolate phosphatase-like HAD superfamily hydrolase
MLNKGICLDFDGTLVNSGPKGTGASKLLRAARASNLPTNHVTKADITALWGKSAPYIINSLWPEADIATVFETWKVIDRTEPLEVFQGIHDALDALSSRYVLSILTNRDRDSTQRQLIMNRLIQYFRFVVTPEISAVKKPKPESMRVIFDGYSQLGISKKDIILVGDIVKIDWYLARDVGVKFFGVLSGGTETFENFRNAGVPEDNIIDSVVDLPDILL